jgi:hypothetical protein
MKAISSQRLISESLFITFSPRSQKPEDLRYLQDALRLQEEAAAQNDRLAANYSSKRLKLTEHVAITVGYIDSSPYIFSTVWRSEFYPAGWYRVLNRRYKAKSHRLYAGNTHIHDPGAFLAKTLEQQTAFLKSCCPDARAVFVSREAYQPRLMSAFQHSLTRHTGELWEQVDGLAQVCPAAASWSCWQHVVFSSLSAEQIVAPFATLTKMELEEKLGPLRFLV